MKFTLQNSLCAVAVVLCALAGSVTSAKADVQSIRSSNNTIWASVGTSLLNYKETVSPIPDSEHGWTPSIAGGVSAMGSSNIYFAVDGSVSFGNAHYQGALLSSPSTPASGTTKETISDISAKVGKGFALGRSAMLTPYGEIGFHYWERKLSGSQVEDYDHFNGAAGLMFQYSPIDRLVLTTYGSAGVTFAAQMKADGDTFELGSAAQYKAGGKLGFSLTPHWEAFTALDFTHFRYVRSPVVNGYLEPSSGTNQTAIRTGLSYRYR